MNRINSLLAGIVGGLLLTGSSVGATETGSFPAKSLYQLESSWIDQDGSKGKLSALAGNPVLLVMVYTRCHGACPMIVDDLKKIDKALNSDERAKLRIALVSFDTDQDTPQHLRMFARGQGLDLKRWSLRQGGVKEVQELAAVLGIQFKKRKDGEFDHSNVITVLNREGEILRQVQGLRSDPKEAVSIIRRVLAR